MECPRFFAMTAVIGMVEIHSDRNFRLSGRMSKERNLRSGKCTHQSPNIKKRLQARSACGRFLKRHCVLFCGHQSFLVIYDRVWYPNYGLAVNKADPMGALRHLMGNAPTLLWEIAPAVQSRCRRME